MRSETVADTMNKIKSGEITLDELLYPGRMLHDVDVNKLAIKVVPSGFPSLDAEYMLLKENEGELIIVGGRPSMGKSAFMFQIALQVSKTLPVHVFSLEMSQESILRRLLAAKLNRPIAAIQRGLVNEKELTEAKAALAEYKYFIDDRAGLSVELLCDAARSRAKREKTALVVVDYLQLLRTEKGHSRDAEIGSITKELKGLAKDLRCPVVVGSQLNRGCETRGGESGNYRPILSDLRESGNIEQDSDIILAVHREYRYTKQRADEADILLLKNRNGPVGDVVMKFFAAQTMFQDVSGEV